MESMAEEESCVNFISISISISNTNIRINIAKMRLTKLFSVSWSLDGVVSRNSRNGGQIEGGGELPKLLFRNHLQFQITQVLFLYKCVLPEWRWINKAVVKKVASHLFLPLLLP